MSFCHAHVRRMLSRAAVIASAAALLVTLSPAPSASSHGSSISPPSRHYDCWDRWGADFQNPAMETEDPMCWQAWQADPNAMWNWNGLYRENVNNDHQAVVPDGQLCSGGQTGGTRYAALDEPGEWHTVSLGEDFTLQVGDQASHGADYVKVYVSEQGFDPTTQKLSWDDLELVAETGEIPASEAKPNDDPDLGGVIYEVPASAPGRSGHHVVYVIWRASHADQNYYACSDVTF